MSYYYYNSVRSIFSTRQLTTYVYEKVGSITDFSPYGGSLCYYILLFMITQSCGVCNAVVGVLLKGGVQGIR